MGDGLSEQILNPDINGNGAQIDPLRSAMGAASGNNASNRNRTSRNIPCKSMECGPIAPTHTRLTALRIAAPRIPVTSRETNTGLQHRAIIQCLSLKEAATIALLSRMHPVTECGNQHSRRILSLIVAGDSPWTWLRRVQLRRIESRLSKPGHSVHVRILS